MSEVLVPLESQLFVAEKPSWIQPQFPTYDNRFDAHYALQAQYDQLTAPLFDRYISLNGVGSFRQYSTSASWEDFMVAGFTDDPNLDGYKKVMFYNQAKSAEEQIPLIVRLGKNNGQITNPAIAGITLGFNLVNTDHQFHPTLSKDYNKEHPDEELFRWMRGISGQEPLLYDSERRIGVPSNWNHLNSEVRIVSATINLLQQKVTEGNFAFVFDSEASETSVERELDKNISAVMERGSKILGDERVRLGFSRE